MNTILHDPTRGWLLLTEKWPGERPDSTPFRKTDDLDGWLKLDIEYHQKVKACLSTAIEIAKEDWDVILDTDQFYDQVEVNEGKYQYSKIQDHHPYTVEAEFEVVTQWKTYTMWSYKEHKGCLTRQIARLVKAKEEWQPKDPGPAGHFNPTDSVTSDGTKATCACVLSDTPCNPNCSCKNPVMSGGCYNCATYGNEEQRKRAAEAIQKRLQDFLNKPTETQDELWAEFEIESGLLIKPSAFMKYRKARKSFRIERI